MDPSAALLDIDAPVPSISTQGEMATAAAGMGKPASRAATSIATVKPPPAESPAIAIEPGAIPWLSSARYPDTASSTAAGNGFSGASR